jgi:PAS domain S-box-containing protein
MSTDDSLVEQLAGSSTPMWIFDQETLRFLEVNQAALERYGYTRQEFLALTVLDIRPPTDIPQFLHSNVLHPHPCFTSEHWKHLTKDGRIFEVEIQSRKVRFRGHAAELVCATLPNEDSLPTLDFAGRVAAES